MTETDHRTTNATRTSTDQPSINLSQNNKGAIMKATSTLKRVGTLTLFLTAALAIATASASSVNNALLPERTTAPDQLFKGNAMDIDQNAPAITRDEIFIAAPLSTVWKLFTNISRWPEWHSDISSARLDGPLAAGTVFRWSTAGLDDIASTIGDVIPEQRIAWSGPAQGIMGIHVWTFTPVQNGVLVRTEESWSGEPVLQQLEVAQQGLDQSISSWLENLKRESEARAQNL